MILGQALMWVAFVASVCGFAAFLLSIRSRAWLGAARSFHVLMAVALFGASAYLMTLILNHQFQVSYVYRYSSRDLPLHFLISTFWAGQEGTFLLWALYTSIFGVVLIATAKRFETGVMPFVLLVESFLLLILVKLSPFTTYPTTPPDGAGLNPLLQDYWMVIHPPLLFVGFASFTIPAAFAMHGMVRKDTDDWVRGALPWTAFSVLVLGTAICLGGYWAYRTLGWGGYWGWDPVENSSLVPWLFSVALLHGLVIQSHRGLLRRFNLFLAICGLMLVLYSTFLTRSGVLGDFSVHSFVDLGINGYLIAFVVVYGVLGYGLYFWRLGGIREKSFGETFLTREYGMFLGSLSITLFAIFVLIGTSAPLLTRIAGEPSNVSMDYYKAIAVPFGILISGLLAVAPNLFWGTPRKSPLWKSLLSPAILAALTTILLFLLGVKGVAYLVMAFTAALAFFVNLEIVLSTIAKNPTRAGGFIVHAGLGLMLIGIITSTIYDRSESVVLPKGQTVEALGYRFLWQGERPIDDGKMMAYDITVITGDGKTVTASPVMFFSAYSNGVMRRPAIKRFARCDLYLAPQGVDRDEALDKMDKRELSLRMGETATVGSTVIRFDSFQPGTMTSERIEIGANLTVTANGLTEIVRPAVIATNDGQQYAEAFVEADGSKIVMRRVDPTEKLALFYVRQPGSLHYTLPTEALYLEASVKPYILILWIGTFLCMGGLVLTVVRRARSARGGRGLDVPVEPAASGPESNEELETRRSAASPVSGRPFEAPSP